jgi:hypothetical protein
LRDATADLYGDTADLYGASVRMHAATALLHSAGTQLRTAGTCYVRPHHRVGAAYVSRRHVRPRKRTIENSPGFQAWVND